MARRRFGSTGETHYDPRWTPTPAAKAARDLFFERLNKTGPEVGESLRGYSLGAFRADSDPPSRYHDLWERPHGLSVVGRWRELEERIDRVKVRRQEKAQRFATLRRTLLAWRRRWNLRERDPMREPWIMDSALWTLRLLAAGASIPPGLILQPLGSMRGPDRIGTPVSFEVRGWDLKRGESEATFRERVAGSLDEYCLIARQAAGFVKITGANKAERDFDFLIKRRILGVPLSQVLHADDLADALDRRTVDMAIARAAERIGLAPRSQTS